MILYHPKLWFSVSGVAIAISIIFITLGGLKFGIDFTGGSLLQINFMDARPEASEIVTALERFDDLGDVKAQHTGDRGVMLRMKNIDNATRSEILVTLNEYFDGVTEESFSSVGPTIGEELRQKSIIALAVVLVAIVFYVAWAFRKVSGGPVSSWVFGLTAIIALFHDIVLTTGLFAILGYYGGVEIDTLFITALLTILGFSVHDTIVVHDRVRENITRNPRADFIDTIQSSVRQTLTRSLNTSLTTLFVLLALLLFTKGSLTYFLVALLAGIFFGTYSSIFIASPLLVVFHRLKK